MLKRDASNTPVAICAVVVLLTLLPSLAAEHATVQRRWGRALLDDPCYSPHLTREREDFSLRLR